MYYSSACLSCISAPRKAGTGWPCRQRRFPYIVLVVKEVSIARSAITAARYTDRLPVNVGDGLAGFVFFCRRRRRCPDGYIGDAGYSRLPPWVSQGCHPARAPSIPTALRYRRPRDPTTAGTDVGQLGKEGGMSRGVGEPCASALRLPFILPWRGMHDGQV